MAIDEIISTTNLGIILIASIVIIALILFFLLMKEKKLKKKIKEENNRTPSYISEIEKIERANPKKILNFIDKIARDFFKEAFKIRRFIGYSELKKTFSRRNNEKAVEFCDLMSKSLYSKEPDGEKIQKIINLLIEIVEANQPVSEEK